MDMKPTTQPTTAQHAYETAQRTARALLDQVSAHLDGHRECTYANEGMVDWGHVGDLTDIVALLQRIVNNA